jgi:hypothetical protein
LGIVDNENTLISPLTLFINTRVGLNAFVAFIHILESIVSERRQAYKSSSKKKIEIKAGENYIALTRFVAQSFYAPKRLIKKIDVVRVPINANKFPSKSLGSNTICCLVVFFNNTALM